MAADTPAVLAARRERLPAMVYARPDISVIDRAHGLHLLLGQRGQGACAAIVLDLPRILPARNDGRDTVEHENPAKGELSERSPVGDQGFQLRDGLETRPVRHAGKRLPDIEGLTVTIEIAMVIRREARRGSELSREQSGSQRHPDDGGDSTPLRLGKEALGWPLAKHVEDDLD